MGPFYVFWVESPSTSAVMNTTSLPVVAARNKQDLCFWPLQPLVHFLSANFRNVTVWSWRKNASCEPSRVLVVLGTTYKLATSSTQAPSNEKCIIHSCFNLVSNPSLPPPLIGFFLCGYLGTATQWLTLTRPKHLIFLSWSALWKVGL